MTDSESKRTEYLRANMSLGERVEALERGARDLKSRADANKELRLILEEDFEALARRVAELEKGRPQLDPRFPAGAPTSDVHIPTECYERTFERVFIDASDLARLRRIEEAASKLLDEMSGYEWDWGVKRDAKALHAAINGRAALDSEPKR